MVSPQNPFKNKVTLLDDYQRLELVHIAIDSFDDFEASSVEFTLPKPSYTVDTLAYLQEKYPHNEFHLIMGGDNLKTIHKWKNFEVLLRDYPIIVYPRPSYDIASFSYNADLHIVSAPQMEISSSLIRQMIKEGRKPHFLLPQAVYKYIDEMHFYRK